MLGGSIYVKLSTILKTFSVQLNTFIWIANRRNICLVLDFHGWQCFGGSIAIKVMFYWAYITFTDYKYTLKCPYSQTKYIVYRIMCKSIERILKSTENIKQLVETRTLDQPNQLETWFPAVDLWCSIDIHMIRLQISNSDVSVDGGNYSRAEKKTY